MAGIAAVTIAPDPINLLIIADQWRKRADDLEASDPDLLPAQKKQIMIWRHTCEVLQARAEYILHKDNESLT